MALPVGVFMLSAKAELARSGTAALMSAAGTELWTVARTAYARVLACGDARNLKLIECQLDELANQVGRADQLDREQVQKQLSLGWQARLTDLLEEHPEVAPELQELTNRMVSQLSSIRQVSIQYVRSSAGSITYGVQCGNQYINHYHGSGSLRTDDG